MDNETILLINDNKLTEIQLERIFALKALNENPGILENVFTFEKLVYVMNGLKPNVVMFDPPTILHIAKAVRALDLKDLNSEIKKFIAHLAFEEGWFDLPGVLSFAQPELDEISNRIVLDEDQEAMQKLKHKGVAQYLNS